MKSKLLIIYFIALQFISSVAAAQSGDAGEYLDKIGKQFDEITADLWSYTSAAAHGKSARKVDNRRKELVSTISYAKSKVKGMPTFNGDKALRDSVYSFLELSYRIINNDYAKIVDMEDIAEQSYDAMEAYLLAQEIAGEKLEHADEVVSEQYKGFAAKNNIRLIENTSEKSAKLEKAGKVSKYYHTVYLIFFKSYKQEAYILDAMAKGDINAIEQNKNALAINSAAGLDTLKNAYRQFEGDPSLNKAATDMLKFYNDETKEKISGMTDYFMKKENFEKIKRTLDTKPQSKRTQADIDQYNKAADDINEAVKKYNAMNDELNKKRTPLLNSWNNAVSSFFDRHTPKYK